MSFLTLAEAGQLIEKRRLSPVDLVEELLNRIEKVDPKINSFIHVLAPQARAAAQIAEKEISSGHYKGPLHGIPLGFKDVIDVADVPTTCHSKIMQDHIPSEDAHLVKLLKQAGAIILGKLAAHEFSFGGPSFDLPWPPARNPWDTTRFTGGSSTGSGAAVAAGLVLGSIGTDSGGSIRGPSALCGISGLKPTFGLVSKKGMHPISYSLDHVGPMAWTAEDCAIMLQGMAGYNPADPSSKHHSIPNYRQAIAGDVKGLKVGLLRHFYENDNIANSATRNAIETAAKKLEELGCVVQEIKVSPLSEWHACGMLIFLAEAYSVHEAKLRTRFKDYGEVFRDRMALAGLITSSDYIHATQRRRELIEEYDRTMESLDIILTSAAPSEASKIDAHGKFSVFERPWLGMPFNLTGSPAMSVCCGYTESGLPLAMQIAGKRFEDAKVLRLAHAYEQATPWRKSRPQI